MIPIIKNWLQDQEWYRKLKGGTWYCHRFITDMDRTCLYWWSRYKIPEHQTIEDQMAYHEKIGGRISTVATEEYYCKKESHTNLKNQ